MANVALIIVYCLEIANYYTTYYIFFHEKLKRFLIPLFGGIGIELLYIMKNGYLTDSNWIAIYLAPLLVLTTIQLLNRMWKPLRILIVFFVETCISEIISGIVEFVTRGIGLSLTSLQNGLLVYTIVLLIGSIILLCKTKLSEVQKEKLRLQSQRNIIFAIIIMSMIILFTIGGLNWVKNYIDNPKFQILVAGLSSLSYGCVGLLVFFSYYMFTTNKKIENMMDNLISLQDMHNKYYNTLLERESDTRKYRHDMGNHLICLENLLLEENYDAMKQYLNQMQKQMHQIQKKSYSVGNDILNILTNHYVARLNDSAKIIVSGHIHTEMDSMKLCTIYANLLQNAVEELEQCEADRYLEITFKQGVEFFQIEIWNSLSERHLQEQSAQILKTQKADRHNHGIGISNVKRTAEELGGTVTVGREGNFFHVLVSLRT